MKDECRFLGDYAFKHFYIDYDLQREKKFTWESITNNLLNSQSKFHNVLTGKKGFTEVTADDIFKNRKMVMTKRDDGSIIVVMQDDPAASSVTKNSQVNGMTAEMGRTATGNAEPEPGGGSPLTAQ